MSLPRKASTHAMVLHFHARSLGPVLLLCLTACGGGPELPPLAPVTGSVTVGSEPVVSGQITLIPLTVDEKLKVPPSTGQIDSAGNYRIFTGGKAGAPLGKYKVTITPSMVPMEGAKGPPKTPYNEMYQKMDKTKAQLEVVADPKPGAYDLNLTK
jgi:hypothetical protein